MVLYAFLENFFSLKINLAWNLEYMYKLIN